MKNQRLQFVRVLIALTATVALCFAISACSGDKEKKDRESGPTEESTENTGSGSATNPNQGTSDSAKESTDNKGTENAGTTKTKTAPAGSPPAATIAGNAKPTIPAPAPVALPPGLPAAGGAHLGDWVMDVDSLLAAPEAKNMPPEQLEMMKSMMGSMSFKFTEDKFVMNAMGKTQEMAYSIKSKEGNKMVITMAAGHGGGGEAEMTVQGDKLILSKPGQKQPMVLKRK